MSDSLSTGNGHGRMRAETLEIHFPDIVERPARMRRRPLWPALILFLLTVVSTLAVGAEFAGSYTRNQEPFSSNPNPFRTMIVPFQHPEMLVLGIPFSFTLLTILFAHEMGHYIACRIYGIDVSYPYFIPAPTLFGTFGAFIRIRSPIPTRRVLFDIGAAGPVAGFTVAVPAMLYAAATSKIVPEAQYGAGVIFGNPLLVRLSIALFHPHVDSNWVLLSPVGRAAWVGFFVTALNLLPAWQLDGGHVLYSLTSRFHRYVTFAISIALILLGYLAWPGWYVWGGLILVLSLRFRHPPLLAPWEPLGASRRAWAVAVFVIFVLCFILSPVR